MAFKLSPEAQERAAQYESWFNAAKRDIGSLSDENLVATCRMYMAHAEPKRFAPGEPVYDATLWHVIMPELMRRLA